MSTEHLILRPTVWCDRCPLALFYSRLDDEEEILYHPKSKCIRSEQKFKRQTIELERIDE